MKFCTFSNYGFIEIASREAISFSADLFKIVTAVNKQNQAIFILHSIRLFIPKTLYKKPQDCRYHLLKHP